jgi:hypothetical protein
MDQRTRRLLVQRLNQDAGVLADRFRLRYKSIEAERANVKNRYGVCDSDGVIKIRLRHVSTGRPLKYSSLVNTLCHELAHLRHFNHGLRFRAFYQEILEFARDQSIYRPGPIGRQTQAPPRQAGSVRGTTVQAEATPTRRRAAPAPAKAAQLSLF